MLFSYVPLDSRHVLYSGNLQEVCAMNYSQFSTKQNETWNNRHKIMSKTLIFVHVDHGSCKLCALELFGPTHENLVLIVVLHFAGFFLKKIKMILISG